MKVLAVCEEDSPYTDRLILLIAGDCVLHPVFTAYRAGEHCTGKKNPGEKKKKKEHLPARIDDFRWETVKYARGYDRVNANSY